MTRLEWQEFYGFTDEEVERIELFWKCTGGKITEIYDKPLDYEYIKYNRKNNTLHHHLHHI